jgi:hypothetical protein
MDAFLNYSQLSLGCLGILINLMLLDYLWESLTYSFVINYKIYSIRVLCTKKISKKVNQKTDQLSKLRKLHFFRLQALKL